MGLNKIKISEQEIMNLHHKFNDISMRLNRINGQLIEHEGDPVVDALMDEANEVRERLTKLKELLVILEDNR